MFNPVTAGPVPAGTSPWSPGACAQGPSPSPSQGPTGHRGRTGRVHSRMAHCAARRGQPLGTPAWMDLGTEPVVVPVGRPRPESVSGRVAVAHCGGAPPSCEDAALSLSTLLGQVSTQVWTPASFCKPEAHQKAGAVLLSSQLAVGLRAESRSGTLWWRDNPRPHRSCRAGRSRGEGRVGACT